MRSSGDAAGAALRCAGCARALGARSQEDAALSLALWAGGNHAMRRMIWRARQAAGAGRRAGQVAALCSGALEDAALSLAFLSGGHDALRRLTGTRRGKATRPSGSAAAQCGRALRVGMECSAGIGALRLSCHAAASTREAACASCAATAKRWGTLCIGMECSPSVGALRLRGHGAAAVWKAACSQGICLTCRNLSHRRCKNDRRNPAAHARNTTTFAHKVEISHTHLLLELEPCQRRNCTGCVWPRNDCQGKRPNRSKSG